MLAAEAMPAPRWHYFAIEAHVPGPGNDSERGAPSTLELTVGDITDDDSVRRQGLSSLALPSIGTGVLGYPGGEAAPIIVSTVIDELAQEVVPFRVRIVLFGPAILETYANAAEAYLAKSQPRPHRGRPFK
jgi:hypothetical protein